jgi:hypothetical protein
VLSARDTFHSSQPLAESTLEAMRTQGLSEERSKKGKKEQKGQKGLFCLFAPFCPFCFLLFTKNWLSD